MQIDETRVIVIHNGYDTDCDIPKNLLKQDEARKKYSLGEAPYIVYLGLIKEHKNTARLIQAFKQLIDLGYTGNLLLIGKEDLRYSDARDKVRAHSLQGRVFFLGHVESKERITLLQGAELYTMPSLYEGFGIPILEAMASEVPVVCSKTTSLPEIAGDAARYFHPLRPDDIARVMKEVLASSSLQSQMIALGKEQVKKFSWEKMANETFEVYTKILGNTSK